MISHKISGQSLSKTYREYTSVWFSIPGQLLLKFRARNRFSKIRLKMVVSSVLHCNGLCNARSTDNNLKHNFKKTGSRNKTKTRTLILVTTGKLLFKIRVAGLFLDYNL